MYWRRARSERSGPRNRLRLFGSARSPADVDAAIGTISGEVPVQAEFLLRGAQQAALEVPYRINNDFGLTAISEAVRGRMEAAGYSQSVEAYVLLIADIHPK